MTERGFSLIELLIITAILGILGQLGLTAFWVYKDNAEYAVGQATLRNVRVNSEDGDLEAEPGTVVPLVFTTDAGGRVAGQLQEILPGAVTPEHLLLGASYDYCDSEDPPMQVKQLIVVKPCRSTRRLQLLKFCNGVELLQEGLPGGCP